jgi:hypothetical protein
MKAVIYRHNPTLAALVAKAKPDFVHEFPSEMSVEDIRKVLKEQLATPIVEFFEKLYGDRRVKAWRDWTFHVDATVMAAGIECSPCSLLLIRQDNAGAYDLYATCVAEAAKPSGRVVVVSDKIADHNNEAITSTEDWSRYYNDSAYQEEMEGSVTQKWVERLTKCGATPEVVSVDRALSMSLRGVVVVCDHHARCSRYPGHSPQKLIPERGGVYFNSFPSYRDDDFLAT